MKSQNLTPISTMPLGAVHKRRRQLGGEEGSKIGQKLVKNWSKIGQKTADVGEGGVKIRKNC